MLSLHQFQLSPIKTVGIRKRIMYWWTEMSDCFHDFCACILFLRKGDRRSLEYLIMRDENGFSTGVTDAWHSKNPTDFIHRLHKELGGISLFYKDEGSDKFVNPQDEEQVKFKDSLSTHCLDLWKSAFTKYFTDAPQEELDKVTEVRHEETKDKKASKATLIEMAKRYTLNGLRHSTQTYLGELSIPGKVLDALSETVFHNRPDTRDTVYNHSSKFMSMKSFRKWMDSGMQVDTLRDALRHTDMELSPCKQPRKQPPGKPGNRPLGRRAATDDEDDEDDEDDDDDVSAPSMACSSTQAAELEALQEQAGKKRPKEARPKEAPARARPKEAPKQTRPRDARQTPKRRKKNSALDVGWLKHGFDCDGKVIRVLQTMADGSLKLDADLPGKKDNPRYLEVGDYQMFSSKIKCMTTESRGQSWGEAFDSLMGR